MAQDSGGGAGKAAGGRVLSPRLWSRGSWGKGTGFLLLGGQGVCWDTPPHPHPRSPRVLTAPSSLQPEPESLGPVTAPGFAAEQEEDELHRTLGVERFEEILQEAGSRGGEELGRSYGEEDFECEGVGGGELGADRVLLRAGGLGAGRGWGPASWRGGSRAHWQPVHLSLQTIASLPITSTTRCPPTCLLTPGAERHPRAQGGSPAGAPEPPRLGRPPPSRRARKRRMRPVRPRGLGPSASLRLPPHPLPCR